MQVAELFNRRRVQVAKWLNGGRSEGVSGCMGCSTERGLRVLVAGLSNGGRSEGASG